MALLRVERVSVRFGAFRALDGVSLEIGEGEATAIVGPNGAGKTTLVNVVTGYVTPTSGRVVFKGRDVTRLPPWKRVKLGIARAFQLPRLFWKQSVIENLVAAIASREGRDSDPLGDPDRLYREAERLLRLVGLEDKAWLPASSLAAGERKVLDALMALALKPKLLILDEPTSGVSTSDKRHVMDTMLSAARSEGATVLFVEHDMDIVKEYAERVVALINGRIVADGPPDQVLSNPVVREHLGLD